MNDKEAIDSYIDGGFGVISTAITIANPAMGILAVALQPALTIKLKKWLHKLVDEGKMPQRECLRLEKGIDGMAETLKENSQTEQLRTDSLLQQKADRYCDADDIFEEMINCIKRDSESKKAKFCGNFIGNIPYSSDLSYSNLMQYSKIISQLSYAELCLLNNFYRNYKNKTIDFGKAELYIKRTEDPKANEILSEINHMRNLGILSSHPPYNPGEIIGKVSLSFYGERLYKLMRLHLLDSKDTCETLGGIQRITKYLS